MRLAEIMAASGLTDSKGWPDVDALARIVVDHPERWLPFGPLEPAEVERLRADLARRDSYPIRFQVMHDMTDGLAHVRAHETRQSNKTTPEFYVRQVDAWELDPYTYFRTERESTDREE